MANALCAAGAAASRIDIGHVGIFARWLKMPASTLNSSTPRFRFCGARMCRACRISVRPCQVRRAAFLHLPTSMAARKYWIVRQPCYRRCPPSRRQSRRCAASLRPARIAALLRPCGPSWVSLPQWSRLRVAYHPGNASAVALGGRYDGAGAAFGRARPATGFSMDLRLVAQLVGGDEGAGQSLRRPGRCRPRGGSRSPACHRRSRHRTAAGRRHSEGPLHAPARRQRRQLDNRTGLIRGYQGYGKEHRGRRHSVGRRRQGQDRRLAHRQCAGRRPLPGGHNAGHTLVVGQGAEERVTSSIWCHRASSARAYSATSATASCSTSIT